MYVCLQLNIVIIIFLGLSYYLNIVFPNNGSLQCSNSDSI